jgi:TonB family protein
VVSVTWQVNGKVVPETANLRTFALATRKLPPGTHSLSATAVHPGAPLAAGETRTWTIDNTLPTVSFTLATPVHDITGARGEPHYFVRDEFTMKLDPKDDQPGYVVAEFRVNGDGWHHYYGWPDAPPGTPFRFTPRGTTIKELVYGSLSAEGLSPQPWEPREPGWGTHRIEYRAIDAAGNIGDAKAFGVTIEATPACTSTMTGTRTGDLEVTSGLTCLAPDARVEGHVTVAAGASLVGTRARIAGNLTGSGAGTIELIGTTIDGNVKVTGATGRLTLFGVTVGGDAAIAGTQTTRAALIVGSSIAGALNCTDNYPAPEPGGTTAARGMTGQCAEFGRDAHPAGTFVPQLRELVDPIYPPDAIKSGLEGHVDLEVVVEIDGSVGDVRVIRSPARAASLERAAIAAARKWRFSPATADRGRPVRAVATLTMSFFRHKPGTTDGPPFTESGLTQRSADDPLRRAEYPPGMPGLVHPRVTRQVEPRYTSEAMRQKITGTVEVEVTIDSDGRVSRARVVKSLDSRYGLDESAIRAAQQWRFTPARLNGKPVPTTVRIVLEFKLH